MASFASISFFVLAIVCSVIANDTPTNQTQTQNLGTAIQEMQKANYFAFVMLLNMVPGDKIPTNVTFLMPNNRVLAKAVIPENDVLDFLLRHSIPCALRFDHLSHFPSGSIIPSSEPNFTLRVSNNGRKSFFLNNVKLISPDICLAGSSIRCHGIDQVLHLVEVDTPPQQPSNTPPLITAPPPAALLPSGLPSPTMGGTSDLAPAATPQPAGPDATPKKSGSSHFAANTMLTICLFWVLSMVNN